MFRELHCFQGGVAQLHHGRLVVLPVRVEERVLGQRWSSEVPALIVHKRGSRMVQPSAEVGTMHLEMHFHPQWL